MLLVLYAALYVCAGSSLAAIVRPQKALSRQTDLDSIDPSCRTLGLAQASSKAGTIWAGNQAEWGKLPVCDSSQIAASTQGGRW